jgi:hypothetical protein
MTPAAGERLSIFSKEVGSLRDPDRHLETRTGHARSHLPTRLGSTFR